jgi:tetratricopeptide (TPR) repeat protein
VWRGSRSRARVRCFWCLLLHRCGAAGCFPTTLPPPTEKHYALGMQRLRKEDWAGAAAEFKEVVKLDNGRVDAYDKLGVALAKKGKSDGAKVAFEKALQLNPRDAVAHENLATAAQRKMARPKTDERR